MAKKYFDNMPNVDKKALKHSLLDYIYVVMSGQSNAVGITNGGDMTVDNNVEVWNTLTGAWETATSSNVHDVAQNGLMPDKNNIGWQFCKLLSMVTGRKVRYVISAYGGASITEWETVEGLQYIALKTSVVASGIPYIDYFLWHQGEADVLMDLAVYESKLNSFIANFRSESFYDRFTLFLAGQLKQSGGQGVQNKTINKLEANSDNSICVVDATGLIDAGDAHFSGEHIDIFAKRFFHRTRGQAGVLSQLYLKIASISGQNDNRIIRMNGIDDIQGSQATIDDDGHFSTPGYVQIAVGRSYYIGTQEVIGYDGFYTYFKANIANYFEKPSIFAQGIKSPSRVYADNAAAIAGGLVVGEHYNTATGEYRIVV